MLPPIEHDCSSTESVDLNVDIRRLASRAGFGEREIHIRFKKKFTYARFNIAITCEISSC